VAHDEQVLVVVVTLLEELVEVGECGVRRESFGQQDLGLVGGLVADE